MAQMVHQLSFGISLQLPSCRIFFSPAQNQENMLWSVKRGTSEYVNMWNLPTKAGGQTTTIERQELGDEYSPKSVKVDASATNKLLNKERIS